MSYDAPLHHMNNLPRRKKRSGTVPNTKESQPAPQVTRRGCEECMAEMDRLRAESCELQNEIEDLKAAAL